MNDKIKTSAKINMEKTEFVVLSKGNLKNTSSFEFPFNIHNKLRLMFAVFSFRFVFFGFVVAFFHLKDAKERKNRGRKKSFFFFFSGEKREYKLT